MTATTTIPADWDVADPSTWTLWTTVDAHLGHHHTGMVMREFREITHAATDHESAGEIVADIGDDDPAEHAAWWADVLGAAHDAEIALAEASPEALAAAAAALGLVTDPDRGVSARDAIGEYLEDGDMESGAAKARRVAAALRGA